MLYIHAENDFLINLTEPFEEAGPYTTGVGTTIYAAPEQLQGSDYSCKVCRLVYIGLSDAYCQNQTQKFHVLRTTSKTQNNILYNPQHAETHTVVLSGSGITCFVLSLLSFQSDMYSLGLILFELYHPFQTEMERIDSIQEVRKRSIPAAFEHKWTKQVRPLRRMFRAIVKQIEKLNESLAPSYQAQLTHDQSVLSEDYRFFGLSYALLGLFAD